MRRVQLQGSSAMHRFMWVCWGLMVSVWAGAQEPNPPSPQFLQFVRDVNARSHAGETVPTSLAAWREQETALRARLLASWGGFPSEPCPLNPQKLGELQRPGDRW